RGGVVSGRDGEPGACPTEGPRNERDRERFCDEADADTTDEPARWHGSPPSAWQVRRHTRHTRGLCSEAERAAAGEAHAPPAPHLRAWPVARVPNPGI